jgi:hypothetical protein
MIRLDAFSGRDAAPLAPPLLLGCLLLRFCLLACYATNSKSSVPRGPTVDAPREREAAYKTASSGLVDLISRIARSAPQGMNSGFPSVTFLTTTPYSPISSR